jgi:hypothetical protein
MVKGRKGARVFMKTHDIKLGVVALPPLNPAVPITVFPAVNVTGLLGVTVGEVIIQ